MYLDLREMARYILVESCSIKSSSPVKIGLDPFTLNGHCFQSTMHKIKLQNVRICSFPSKAGI